MIKLGAQHTDGNGQTERQQVVPTLSAKQVTEAPRTGMSGAALTRAEEGHPW